MRIITFLVLFLFTTPFVHAQGCWSSVELSRIAQKSLDGEILFSFKDAVTCQTIKGVKVKFLGKEFHDRGDGYVAMPVPPDSIDGDFPIVIQKDGYIPIKQYIPISFGTYWQDRFVMSKELPIQSARFVLAWGEKPRDLDLHLVADDFHISYRKKRSIANKVWLDRDAMQGFGPETITLKKLDKNKTYKVLVYNYSHEAPIDEKTVVSIYTDNKLKKNIYLKDIHSKCVQVATIQNNKVTYNLIELPDGACR